MRTGFNEHDDRTAHLREMVRLIGGYRVSQAIHVAVELGVPDLLIDGPQTAEELARTTGAHAENLYRLLRFLAGVGVLQEVSARAFVLTPFGSVLRSDVPGTPSLNVKNWLHEPQWAAWGDLLASVRTGRPAFDRRHGKGLFSYLQGDAEFGRRFNAAQTANTIRYGLAIAGSYDFSDIDTLVDVGGGQGRLLASILGTTTHLRGVLFDAPQVTDEARTILAQAGITERCDVVAGDFFDSVPPGGSAYLLSHIIHDWDDIRAVQILRNCRNAAAAHAKLLVFERLVRPDHAAGLSTLHIDLEMMVNLGGQERTEQQFRALFAEAGIAMTRVVPIRNSDHVLIEGAK